MPFQQRRVRRVRSSEENETSIEPETPPQTPAEKRKSDISNLQILTVIAVIVLIVALIGLVFGLNQPDKDPYDKKSPNTGKKVQVGFSSFFLAGSILVIIYSGYRYFEITRT